MTETETKAILRLLGGHWPHPALSDDETLVWIRTLQPMTAQTAKETIDRIAASGREFRPSDGIFTAAYRQATARKLREWDDPTPELAVSTEHLTPAESFAKARAALGEAAGQRTAKLAARNRRIAEERINAS
jgi:hypothetical protein